MCQQIVELAEEVMKQLGISYRNARNFLKSNINAGGTTS